VDRAGRTHIDTFVAVGAAGFKVKKLGHRALGFRIAAPQTVQRTSFQKNGGPDARTVLNRKSLYIEYPHGLVFLIMKGDQKIQLDGFPLTTKPLIPSLVSKLMLIGLTFFSTYLSITQVIPLISKTSSLSFNSSRVRRKDALHAHPPPPNFSIIRMTEVGFCLTTSISFSWASGVMLSIASHLLAFRNSVKYLPQAAREYQA
jgi:hypothetical protein